MDVVREEQFCLENKQSDVTSSCSVSDGSCGGAVLKSPRVCSPATSSPSHRRTTGPIRRAKGGWTQEEDETLRNAVEAFKGRCWKKIAEFFPDRSEVQCLHRWQKVLNPELIKGPWTQKEDEKIVELVSNYGPTKWSSIAKSLPGRIGKQCRERWHNHLNPNIKKDAWTLEEELLLMNAQRVHGNKWAEIAKVLPGRTDNSIKNHWNSSLKKKLDFYLATGRLPPFSKTGQNDVKGISQATDDQNFLVCSNKASDTAAESSLADLCKVDGNHEDQQGSMQQCLYMDASTRDMFIDPSSAVEWKSQLAGCEERENCSSGSDFSYSNCDSTPTSIKYRNDLVSDRDNNIAGTPLHCVVPAFGSSFCEPAHSDNYDVPLNGAVFNKLCSFQQTNDSNSVASLGSFTKDAGLGRQSAESILKNAAKSFPNTPSIVKRKRKRDLHASVSVDRTKESIDKGKIKDGLQTPEQTERTEKQDQSSSINSSLCESSICHGTVGLCNGRALNTSPPYRLRSKRTAVFKSVEKQLDFTSEIDKIEASNQPMNVTIKEKPHDAENCPQMEMDATK